MQTIDFLKLQLKLFCDKADCVVCFVFPDNPRCPVKAYKLYRDKRPEGMQGSETPFYLGVGKNEYGKWFVSQAMGKNTIAKIVKSMCEDAEIPGKKTNHSLRRTAITTLLHSGFEPTVVQQLSAHKRLESLNEYSSASMGQQKKYEYNYHILYNRK